MSASMDSTIAYAPPIERFPRTNFRRDRMNKEQQAEFDVELREAPPVQPRLKAETMQRRPEWFA